MRLTMVASTPGGRAFLKSKGKSVQLAHFEREVSVSTPQRWPATRHAEHRGFAP